MDQKKNDQNQESATKKISRKNIKKKLCEAVRKGDIDAQNRYRAQLKGLK